MTILELSVASGHPLSVRRFNVSEAVSSLTSVSVWARCIEADVDLEAILGKEASLHIVHGTIHVAGLGSRTWKGVCTHIEQVNDRKMPVVRFHEGHDNHLHCRFKA